MRTLFLIVCLTVLSSAYAEDDDWFEPEEGAEYHQVKASTGLEAKKKGHVNVMEVFCYACPHCFKMETHLKPWLKRQPEYVHFKHYPALFFSWMPEVSVRARCKRAATMYFSALQLGVMSPETTAKIYHAIHVEKQDISDDNKVIDMLAKTLQQDRAAVKAAYFSPATQIRLKTTEILMEDKIGISNVPTFVVNGQYWTNATEAGSTENLFKVLDYLIEKIHKGKKLR